MEITNKFNLPQAYFNIAVRGVREPQEWVVSATQLCLPQQIAQLQKKHWKELTEDVSERLWAILGSSVAFALSHADEGALTEHYMETKIGKWTLRGTLDHYHNGKISDYKVTSCYSFLLGDKPEWEQQLNIYAYLGLSTGLEVDELEINAILRDHQASKGKYDEGYPLIPFVSKKIPLWSYDDQGVFIKAKLSALEQDELIPCTDEERWASPTTYAVMKGDNKKATRVLDSMEEAEKYIEDNKVLKASIVERKGGYRRCSDYCPVRLHCPQNKSELTPLEVS